MEEPIGSALQQRNSFGLLPATIWKNRSEDTWNRKAILATAKASDTLFEAITVANDAFIENNALNEEAERRYATLVSEITKGKNVIKMLNDSQMAQNAI